MYHLHGYFLFRSEEGVALDSELQAIVNSHVGTGNQILVLCKSSHLELVFKTKRLYVICPLLPGRPPDLCSSPAVPRQQAACRSSLSTQGEHRDPQPPTGERCRVTPRTEGRSHQAALRPPFPFLVLSLMASLSLQRGQSACL